MKQKNPGNMVANAGKQTSWDAGFTEWLAEVSDGTQQ